MSQMSLSLRNLDEYVHDLPSREPAWVHIAPILECPVESPAFLLGDLPTEITQAFFSEVRTGPVRCYRLRHVKLTVDGIVLAGENALWTTLLNHPDYYVADIVSRLEPDLDSLPVRRVAGQAVMLSGPGSHIYGHWLIDIMPRLFVLASCGYELSKLRFIVSVSSPAFCRQYLELLGITHDQLIWHDGGSELVEMEELLLPTNLRLHSRLHPLMKPAVFFLQDVITARLSPPRMEPGRRLFISRAGIDPSRTLENRDEIEAIAAAEGYEIVSPETLAIPEQIAMFASAAQIIGEYGSGLHNSVFSPPGTVVMALRGNSHHPGFIQSGISQVFRQPTGYVLSPTPLNAVDQTFSMSEDAFRLGLRCASMLSDRRT